MKKWEYCQLVVNRADPANVESKQLVFLKKDDIDVRQVISVSQTIATLGLAGWELVSHTQTPQPVVDLAMGFPWTEFFTFKRPIK